MTSQPISLRQSVENYAFSQYLRTGRRVDVEALLDELNEMKFNPNHDPDDGRFTFGPGGGSLAPRRQASSVGATSRSEASNSAQTRDIVIAASMTAAGSSRDRAVRKQADKLHAKIVEKRLVQTIAYSRQPAVRSLLHQIARGEGSDDGAARLHGYASSYDVPFNYGRYARQSKPLTQMTLGEIDELQTRMLAHPDNTHVASPVGKYQLVRRTLRDLKAEMGLSDSLVFDAALQDRLGTRLLERRGLQSYVAGRISEFQFHSNIAGEWASIADPKTGGVDASQHLGTTTAQIQPLIRALRGH